VARTVAELPPGTRITDYISLGVISKVFPDSAIGAVLSRTGKTSLRQRDLRQQLRMRERELLSRFEALSAAIRRYLMGRRSRLEQASGKIESLSPSAILERGFSLIFDAHGTLVKDVSQLQPGDRIQARLSRGQFDARVESLRKGEPKSSAD